MSKETLDVVRESWRRSRCNGAVLGTIFRFNLGSINPCLVRADVPQSEPTFDLELFHAVDAVVNSLENKQKLVQALRNLSDIFQSPQQKRIEVEHLSKAILVTIEQVMADDFTLQIGAARSLMTETFRQFEPTAKEPVCKDQWIRYIKKSNRLRGDGG